MSESSGGGGSASPSSLVCVHCKKELSEPCESCQFCGKPQEDSGVPRCFECEIPLFTPNQKICHECGARNPNRSTPTQQQADSKPPPSTVDPIQPEPSRNGVTSSGAVDPGPHQTPQGEVKEHYEEVQQAVQAQMAQQGKGMASSRHEGAEPGGEGGHPGVGGAGDKLGGGSRGGGGGGEANKPGAGGGQDDGSEVNQPGAGGGKTNHPDARGGRDDGSEANQPGGGGGQDRGGEANQRGAGGGHNDGSEANHPGGLDIGGETNQPGAGGGQDGGSEANQPGAGGGQGGGSEANQPGAGGGQGGGSEANQPGAGGGQCGGDEADHLGAGGGQDGGIEANQPGERYGRSEANQSGAGGGQDDGGEANLPGARGGEMSQPGAGGGQDGGSEVNQPGGLDSGDEANQPGVGGGQDGGSATNQPGGLDGTGEANKPGAGGGQNGGSEANQPGGQDGGSEANQAGAGGGQDGGSEENQPGAGGEQDGGGEANQPGAGGGQDGGGEANHLGAGGGQDGGDEANHPGAGGGQDNGSEMNQPGGLDGTGEANQPGAGGGQNGGSEANHLCAGGGQDNGSEMNQPSGQDGGGETNQAGGGGGQDGRNEANQPGTRGGQDGGSEANQPGAGDGQGDGSEANQPGAGGGKANQPGGGVEANQPGGQDGGSEANQPGAGVGQDGGSEANQPGVGDGQDDGSEANQPGGGGEANQPGGQDGGSEANQPGARGEQDGVGEANQPSAGGGQDGGGETNQPGAEGERHGGSEANQPGGGVESSTDPASNGTDQLVASDHTFTIHVRSTLELGDKTQDDARGSTNEGSDTNGIAVDATSRKRSRGGHGQNSHHVKIPKSDEESVTPVAHPIQETQGTQKETCGGGNQSGDQSGAESSGGHEKPPSYADAAARGQDKEEARRYRKAENAEELFSGKPSSPTPRGIPRWFTAGSEKSITVTFHALLPKYMWEWNSKSKMFICFGDLELGDWKYGYGPFMEFMMLSEGLCEMTHTIPIAAHLLRNKRVIPYKYIVYSMKSAEDKDPFEYVHHYGNSVVNRALQLTTEQFNTLYGAEYHHYDTVVYPRNVKKSFSEKAKAAVGAAVGATVGATVGAAVGTVVGWFSGKSGQPSQEDVEASVLTLPQMCEVCLHVYLETFRNLLSNLPEGFNICSIARQIEHIVSFLRWPKFVYLHHNMADVKTQKYMPQKTKEWLESIVADLTQMPRDESGKQMRSALTIAYCFYTLALSKPKLDEFALPLLGLLQLGSDVKRRECPEYQLVCSAIPDQQVKEEVARGISNLMVYAQARGLKNDEWIGAIPLYHFLMGHAQPFEKPEMDPRKITWGEDAIKIKLHGIRQIIQPGCISDCLRRFQPLMVADPLLLRGLLYMCPTQDFHAVFHQIPPFLSISLLLHRIALETTTLNNSEAKEWSDLIYGIRRVIEERAVQETMKPEFLYSEVDASVLLCTHLRPKLSSSSTHFVELLKSSLSLVLLTVANFNTLYPDEENVVRKDMVASALGTLDEILGNWIADRKVIGGSMFGGSAYTPTWDAEKEIQVWHSILQLKCPQDTEVADKWLKIVRTRIQHRVNQVTIRTGARTDLVCLLEKDGDVHPVLSDIFMEAAMETVDEMLKKTTKEAARDIERLTATHSERVGKLLGTLLKKKYPQLDPEVPPCFDELLAWQLWPNFIKILASGSKLIHGMPEECREFCLRAVSVLTEVCDKVHRADITLWDLQNITKAKEQMKQLCQAASKDGAQKEQLSFKNVQAALQSRMHEYRVFAEHQHHLSHLCDRIPSTVQGKTQLSQQLKKNYSNEMIRSLCTNKDGRVEILCFKSAASLTPFAADFHIMSASELFLGFWRSKMDTRLRSGPAVTLDNMVDVWTSAFQGCQKLLKAVQDQSIKLEDVDRELRQRQNLESQLLKLHDCVCLCTRVFSANKREEVKEIHSALAHVHAYWDVCNYHTTANVFLNIRDSLNLTKGDFKDVEKLSNKLSSCMRGQTLRDIDDGLIQTGRFLKDIAQDRHRVECLEAFAKCQNVVSWLKDVTKDVNDLQNFVNVALATAAGGEDDLAHDKLSNLRAVGSGFGSLIYKLPPDAGYREVSAGCITLWEALRNNPNLKKMLEDCSKELDWYKGVKETQGSVEVTSYGQMDNILAFGLYRVGVTTKQRAHGIHEVIQLKLDDRRKQLPKTSYTLDELRDLESKLVLITGSKADNRRRVDQFLNTLHSVCRIAEVLIALQQAGNVKNSGWRMEFLCRVDMVDELQEQARKMEDELKEWKTTVRESRDQFYHLNNYTTLQLLALRESLGQLKDPAHASTANIDPSVLALLQSISPEVYADGVRDVVYHVAHSLSGQRETEEEGRVMEEDCPSPVHQVLPMVDQYVDLAGPLAPAHGANAASVDYLRTVSETASAAGAQASCPAKDGDSTQSSHPKLTERDLDEKQREIYAKMFDSNAFPPQLVLRALQECGSNRYKVEGWLIEHELEFELSDSEEEKEEEEEEAISEASHSDQDPESTHPHGRPADDEMVRPKPTVPTQPSGSPTKVSITTRQPITEFHPVVVELTDVGYPTEQAIEAVERCGSNVQACMDYILAQERGEGEGELFQSSVLTEHDPVHEMPMEGFTTYTSFEGEIQIFRDEVADSRYLSLMELGVVLEELSKIFPPSVQESRRFLKSLKEGTRNLIVAAPENILRITLSLFMEDEANPLPTLEEVLVCTEQTTAEEVTLLWRRALGDPDFRRIFCLVHAEKLSYKECDKALHSLSLMSQGKTDPYRLAIICSSEDEEKSHIISKLHNDRRPYMIPPESRRYQDYLKRHFRRDHSDDTQHGLGVKGACVDHENLCVRVVSSTRSGMGKSLYISRMADRLRLQCLAEDLSVTIPVHGPVVTQDTVMEFLKEYLTNSAATIFHFDISPSVLYKVDTILFSLLILRGLTDSQGRVWRCHPTQLYAVEVTLPEVQDDKDVPECCSLALLDLLPKVECCSPLKAMELMRTGRDDPNIVVMDRQEFEGSAYQRVYQYIQRNAVRLNLDRFSYTLGSVEGGCANCLEIILSSCGIRDPSWSEVCHFVSFLDIQLQSCEDSVFCDENLVGDVMSGLKGFVVKFMIRMSMDFATSSLVGEVARENDEAVGDEVRLEEYQIAERRKWEQSSHPYIFFNKDRMSITFVGFKVTQNGDLIDPRRGGVLEPSIMTQQLYTGLKQNQVNFEEDFVSWPKDVMIQKIAAVMGIDFPYDPDASYVLTVDNLIKILAIHMRFRCGIPVVIMGETGCGKTRLIRYMCDVARHGVDTKNMLIMKVHGGTTEKDVTAFVHRGEAQALENRKRKIETVLFFDEANTTDAIGLIKEVMCDRRLHGKSISIDIKFIAACNPYRKHTDKMIEKLESAGLGFYVKASQTDQKLGKIPLRQLVYRVLDLPPSMRPLVYDFGQLNTGTERDYTRQIVTDHVRKHPQLSQQGNGVIDAVARALAWSQWYMRQREDECSFVSLRDVERAMVVFEYFFEKMEALFGPLINEKAQEEGVAIGDVNDVTRSLLLAVCVCYHTRLQDREEYDVGVSQQLGIRAERFRAEIRWCQEVLLDSMELGHNIARNTALRENIFMMAICIELRIPLFLVGKPGSSKSLAKSVVASSMQGQASNSDLLKHFKQVHMFSYQCSQLSTPGSVIEVFNTAKRFQRGQDITKYVSVVVLDEVGLAEDSPNLPLKALHPLLEDGTEGADDSDQIIEREKRVAFIGISNWALDPAKMNRGVMVTRGDPDVEELVLSAKGICSDKKSDPVKDTLEPYFDHLAKAYKSICKKQKREFFGLRDFYSLIKMLYWMCEKSDMHPTWPQLQHAIQRNFGGLEEKGLIPLDEFTRRIPAGTEPDLTNIPEELKPIVNPDCTKLGLIKTSLRTKETSWHGENRYLLFLTENYAALEILRHYLSDVLGVSSAVTSVSASVSDMEGVLEPKDMEPFILFGSSFPKDREYTQVCRNINQIKICMETGRTVILLNLENLYESLYDVLNQYYIYHGGSRYVDLGLQTHRVKCRVHNDFKLILIAERKTVYEKFPTPLINRLEKHFVLTSSVLLEWQKDVLKEFEEWIQQFSNVGDKGFKETDAFIGYQKDTPAAVVFQATNHLESLRQGTMNASRACAYLSVLEMGGIGPEALPHEDKGSALWKAAVLRLSQFLLLHTASPDALVRLKRTPLEDQADELSRIYDHEQCHSSLKNFLSDHLADDAEEGGKLMQVTTHGHLLTGDEINDLRNGQPWQISSFLLQEFDTELDFSNKVGPLFQRNPGSTGVRLLIIQCDSGHVDVDLVACARYRIYDERAKAKITNPVSGKDGSTHVLFIIHLPRQTATSSFVGYQGDPWISTHIDALRNPTDTTITLCKAKETTISRLFYTRVKHEDEAMETEEMPYLETETTGHTEQVAPQTREVPRGGEATGYFLHLHFCIQAAASKLQDSERNKARSTERVDILVGLFPRKLKHLDNLSFHGVLISHICRLLEERDESRQDETEWVLTEALSPEKLQNGGTFRNVLARKLVEVIVPIFAAIIALIDRHYNLDFVRRENENTPVAQFWLAMFRNPQIMKFRYDDLATQGHVPGVGRRMLEDDFKCQLPFSWLIREDFDAQWDNANIDRSWHEVGWANGSVNAHLDDTQNTARLGASGKSLKGLRDQLHDLVSESAVCRVLDDVSEEHVEEFFDLYLDDFVRSMHKSNHRASKYMNLEYKLISDALRGIIAHHPDFSSFDGHCSLSSKIAAVHVVYQSTKSEILWFGQLCSQLPGILEPLQDKVPRDSPEMLLHLYAVERALSSLEPPLEENEGTMIRWLNDIRLSKNTVDSILSIPSDTDICKRARLHWQFIRALQLFVEHVILKHSSVKGMIQYARKLRLYLRDEPDFHKAITVHRVRNYLNVVDKQLKEKVKEIKDIRMSCRMFFMELVSTLCFGGHTTPEPDLVRMLFNTVFTEDRETKEFSYRDVKADTVPVIRSFLLQLLLEHSTVQVKTHLDAYFKRSSQLFRDEVDQNLCLLCIQCFEDALYKEYMVQPLGQQMRSAAHVLRQGHQALQQHDEVRVTSLEYLEGVAQIRYALSLVAELLSKQTTETPFQSHQDLGVFVNHLLPVASEVCTDPVVNKVDAEGSTDIVGPVVYLLKLLVRRYGTHCLQNIVSTPMLSRNWVVPHELQRSEEEQPTIDPFVIYNPHYASIRDSMSTAAYGKDLKDLTEACQELEPKRVPHVLLSLYQTATLSRGSSLPSRHLPPDSVGELDKFIQECKVFSKEMRWIGRALLANQQGGTLAQLAIAPRQPLLQRTLGAIAVHAAVVFQSVQGVDILQPFLMMINNPAALQNAYLPTMPEDSLPEARRIMGGAFYECPRGHPYYVSECGQPVMEYTCPTCGDRIGGQSHRLLDTNRTARGDDNTQTGHCLGPPDRRGAVPAPERTLSPAACCIVRGLMHSALLWASCNNVGATQGLCDLVKPGVRAPHLPEFFWTHLEKDLELLAKATGKSLDEAAVLMHLVLKQIMEVDPPRQSVVGAISSLGARNARAEWEKIFNQTYLQPLLSKLDQSVATAMHSILNDDKQEHDRLFFVVYERVKVVDSGIEPHLWTYRSRITLEHLALTLQRKNFYQKHPILHEFLQQEHNLRATQYLPDIVRLQQRLFDRFNHQLDRKEAKSLTIQRFVRDIKTENIRSEYLQLIGSFQKAWSLVGSQLGHHGRLRVEERYLIPAITDDTPIEFLIPTPTGAGACSMALADFLMLTHNSFIERCMGIVTQREKNKSFWDRHEVPITHIHQCHLLDYEHQLLPIVLAHCRYSLKIGEADTPSYDLPALEKHVLDRFIHGKPLILSDIPQVAYRKDVYTAATFAAVRKKVDPQTPILARVQQEILLELRTIDRLRGTLDIVDIVLGFLSTGGGNPGRSLGAYIKNTLKMRRPFCEKAKESCTLSNILSLWEVLSVELARQITLNGQEPFDSVRPEFKEELEEEEVEALNKTLRLFDLDKLLGPLYEFIETYAKHSPLNEKDWQLADTLESFLERNGQPEVPNLAEGLPDTITLGKAISTWKYIVHFQERQKHE